MIQMLESMGACVWRCCSSSGDGGIVVIASRITSAEPCPNAVRKLRVGFFVIGTLIGRMGEVVVPLPGDVIYIEVVNLVESLISCSACIHGAGTRIMVIIGVKKLHNTDFTIISDRIEAWTFFIATTITLFVISMSPIVPHHVIAVADKLQYMGCGIRHTSLNS
ncbi:unnamed protein product [Calypogeia fissa]